LEITTNIKKIRELYQDIIAKAEILEEKKAEKELTAEEKAEYLTAFRVVTELSEPLKQVERARDHYWNNRMGGI